MTLTSPRHPRTWLPIHSRLAPRRGPSGPGREPASRVRGVGRWAGVALLLLAGGLVFCHGCHGDEDDELSVFVPKVRRQVEQARPGGGATALPARPPRGAVP
jgi:hypothetical protein